MGRKSQEYRKFNGKKFSKVKTYHNFDLKAAKAHRKKLTNSGYKARLTYSSAGINIWVD